MKVTKSKGEKMMRKIYTLESIRISYPHANITCRDGEISENDLYIVFEVIPGIEKPHVILEQLSFKIET